MTDYDLIRRCDVLEILEYEGFLGRTRKLVEQLVAVTPEAQAAEIERLRGDLAKAMLIIEAYSDDEGYIPKRVVHLWNALHCSNQEGICHCGTLWNAAPQP